MNFQPETTIHFCRTGIDDNNKIVCKSQQDLFDVITRGNNVLGVMSRSSFQRADNFYIIRVDHNDIKYYNLMQCDTVLYMNEEPANFYIVGNIISVDWKNEDCSFVRFKIDSFMTYQPFIDWDNTYAYIEREHIKEDWSSDGGNPLFSNFGPSEGFGTVADVPFFSWKKNFTSFMEVVIQSPYDLNGDAVFNGSEQGHLYNSLQTLCTSPSGANNFFQQIAQNKDASINNIVSVFGIPGEWGPCIRNGGNAYGSGDMHENIPAVNIAAKQLPSMIEYNNAKCWAAPFTVIRLMSSEGDTKDFNPQWLGNDQSDYTIRYRAAGAGGQFGGAQCTFMNKNGAFNWDTWNDFIVNLRKLPSCPWTGDGFTNWQSVNGDAAAYSQVQAGLDGLISGLSSIVNGLYSNTKAKGIYDTQKAFSDMALGISSAVVDTIGQELNIAARIQQEKSNGAAVHGGGSFAPILDIGTENWGFRVVYYSTQIYAMRSVDSYFDRFGYLINRLKKLELENRPIWTFIKTIECHIISTAGIPYVHQSVINSMFNSGVTMWKKDRYLGGQQIGDFSKAHDNRGIRGA